MNHWVLWVFYSLVYINYMNCAFMKLCNEFDEVVLSSKIVLKTIREKLAKYQVYTNEMCYPSLNFIKRFRLYPWNAFRNYDCINHSFIHSLISILYTISFFLIIQAEYSAKSKRIRITVSCLWIINSKALAFPFIQVFEVPNTLTLVLFDLQIFDDLQVDQHWILSATSNFNFLHRYSYLIIRLVLYS